MSSLFRALVLFCAVCMGCSLARAPIVDRGSVDGGVGVDAPSAMSDVPEGIDAPVVDAPRVCGMCALGDRCEDGMCTCDPTLCAGTGECIGGHCEVCGTIGVRCCPSSTCRTGACNSADTCEAVSGCASVGADCCAGRRCDGGLECVGPSRGTCQAPCGASGEACCAEDRCDGERLSCQGDDVLIDRLCRPCGGSLQACCPGNVCASGDCVLGIGCS